MPDPLPKFDKPPVAETVLSAQFSRLQKFRTAHAGSFCEAHLGREWGNLEEQPRIDDSFERFGDERKWGPAGGFRFTTSMEAQRTQIVGSDITRMIQVQDSRFIYNWKKGDTGGYPSYAATRKEFDRLYAMFAEFIESHGLGEIEENQWEVTYINHILKGELWDSPRDWRAIFPWLNPPQEYFEPESMQCAWDLLLPDNRGRLHAKLYFGRISLEGPEAIILDLTARGVASSSVGFSIADGFEIGHQAIVRTFTDMTSERAHGHWGRSQ